VTEATTAWLAGAWLDETVAALRPDYRAVLVVADGLTPGPSDPSTERMLRAAEARARSVLGDAPVESHPHVAAWRDAFRAFGAKPQRTRPSVEALLRRLPHGLPRIDRLTDTYNAVSVAHVLPVGGEDLDCYKGSLHLTRAAGDEPFETTADGRAVIDHPEVGEVVWRDDAGVTCRRWNWRQCTRTRLTHATRRAVFVLDALGPMTDEALEAAAQALGDALSVTSPDAELAVRRLGTVGQRPP
jgi:DNA/RNA-binding domain of Phe-tRNA-synthetase-like protein